jgi:anaerobic selenocysteine-containing dehydrogenase
MRALGPRRLVDLFLRTGPHQLSVKALEKAEHGIDLGALEPCLPQRLKNPQQRIALTPAPMLDDLARLEATLTPGPAPTQQLELIGRRDLRSNNSWMHNVARLVKGERRCTLLMHPDDAKARGLASGQKVKLTSAVGEVEVELEVVDDLMPGVVSLPHGWGHHREGIQLGVAQAHAGVSINDVTDAGQVDALSGNAGFSGLKVTVSASPPAPRA